MEIWENRHGNIVILALQGRFDAATSPLFDERVQPMVDRGDRHFLLDLARLDYISSAALRRLLLLSKRMGDAGGKVALLAVPAPILEILDMAGFTPFFPIHASQEEALRSF